MLEQDILGGNSTSSKELSPTITNNGGQTVVIFGAGAVPAAPAAKPVTTTPVPFTGTDKTVAPAIKFPAPVTAAKATESTASTLVGAVLKIIPDTGGLDIDATVSKHRAKVGYAEGLWDRFVSSWSVISNKRDLFTDALIDLGVHKNTAQAFTADDKIRDHEMVEMMAQIGNTTFAGIKPDKATIDEIAVTSKAIEKQEKITLTDDTKQGLARFEIGMLKVLDTRMKNPRSTLGTLFDGAIKGSVLEVEGLVDVMAEGAKAMAVPVPTVK